jgi:hypothetical protein
VSIVAALTLLDFDDGAGASRSMTFCDTGECLHCSTARKEAEAFVAEMGQQPHGVRDLFGAALASAASSAVLHASSLSCGPRKRLPHLLRPFVRPPALSRGGAWRVGTFDLGRLNTGIPKACTEAKSCDPRDVLAAIRARSDGEPVAPRREGAPKIRPSTSAANTKRRNGCGRCAS